MGMISSIASGWGWRGWLCCEGWLCVRRTPQEVPIELDHRAIKLLLVNRQGEFHTTPN